MPMACHVRTMSLADLAFNITTESSSSSSSASSSSSSPRVVGPPAGDSAAGSPSPPLSSSSCGSCGECPSSTAASYSVTIRPPATVSQTQPIAASHLASAAAAAAATVPPSSVQGQQVLAPAPVSQAYAHLAGVLQQFFSTWTPCEQTMVVYQLINKMPVPQVRMLTTKLHEDYTQLPSFWHLVEQQANDPVFLSKLCSESKSATLPASLLCYLPFLKPSAMEAKRIYLSAITKALTTVAYASEQSFIECRQLLLYLLIHPAITAEEKESVETITREIFPNLSCAKQNAAAVIAANPLMGYIEKYYNLTNCGFPSAAAEIDRAGANSEGLLLPPSLPSSVDSVPNINLPPPRAAVQRGCSMRPFTAPCTKNAMFRNAPSTLDHTVSFQSDGCFTPDTAKRLVNLGSPKVSHWPQTDRDNYGLNNLASERSSFVATLSPSDNGRKNNVPLVQHVSADGGVFSNGSHFAVRRSVTVDATGFPDKTTENSQRCQRNSFTECNSGMKDVPLWLKTLRLHKYAPLFAKLSYDEMMMLNEDMLADQGVTKGARHKISVSIAKLKNRVTLMKQMEKDLFDGDNLKSCLNEMKSIIFSPIRKYPPPSQSHLDLSQAKIDGLDYLADEVDDENIPAHFTRVLGKLCVQVMVTSGIDEECVTTCLHILERCLVHEAFTDGQRMRCMHYKNQLRKMWSFPRWYNNGKNSAGMWYKDRRQANAQRQRTLKPAPPQNSVITASPIATLKRPDPVEMQQPNVFLPFGESQNAAILGMPPPPSTVAYHNFPNMLLNGNNGFPPAGDGFLRMKNFQVPTERKFSPALCTSSQSMFQQYPPVTSFGNETAPVGSKFVRAVAPTRSSGLGCNGTSTGGAGVDVQGDLLPYAPCSLPVEATTQTNSWIAAPFVPPKDSMSPLPLSPSVDQRSSLGDAAAAFRPPLQRSVWSCGLEEYCASPLGGAIAANRNSMYCANAAGTNSSEWNARLDQLCQSVTEAAIGGHETPEPSSH